MSKGKKNKRKNNSRICKLPHEKKKEIERIERGKEEKKEKKKTKEKKERRKAKRMMKWGMR